MKTKPKHFINGVPASYVRLGSRVKGCYVPDDPGLFKDSRGRKYLKLKDGSVRRVRG